MITTPRMTRSTAGIVAAALMLLANTLFAAEPPKPAGPDEILSGLRSFYARTARRDGSFQPGIDPDYRGMSDSAYSDLAAVTYAVTLHKTFGWELPFPERTVAFLLGRQKATGEFVNVAGTVRPESPEGRTYNTTQALVALRALGVQPKHDPLPVFEDILKADYKELPPYSTSFFPLAYLCAGRPIPEKADRGIRALMVQDRTGYTNDHIAATFHASHYYHLVGEPTPKSAEMVDRILADQSGDGSWLLHKPSRDRHATFDAVFSLVHEGHGRKDCADAIRRAARWALSCRNPDGGFGHFPGSTSDADAIYFQVGTLVMADVLQPADPLPPDPHLLSWGHLAPVGRNTAGGERLAAHCRGWVGAVAFSPDSRTVLAGCGDGSLRAWDLATGLERFSTVIDGCVAALDVDPAGGRFAAGSYDHTATVLDMATGTRRHRLEGHRGAVLAAAFHPDGQSLATGSVDGAVRLWDPAKPSSRKSLAGHKSWVNAVAFSSDGRRLVSGSSDGTIRSWLLPDATLEREFVATDAEVRSVALSRDGRWLAAGIRYGPVKVWNLDDGTLRLGFKAHESDVWAVAFTPDSTTLVTANGDWNRPGQVKLWNAKTGEPTGTLQHTGEVLSLAVSPDGRYVAAGGGDNMLRVWELKQAQP
jgi:WD40 repeat protein